MSPSLIHPSLPDGTSLKNIRIEDPPSLGEGTNNSRPHYTLKFTTLCIHVLSQLIAIDIIFSCIECLSAVYTVPILHGVGSSNVVGQALPQRT